MLTSVAIGGGFSRCLPLPLPLVSGILCRVSAMAMVATCPCRLSPGLDPKIAVREAADDPDRVERSAASRDGSATNVLTRTGIDTCCAEVAPPSGASGGSSSAELLSMERLLLLTSSSLLESSSLL